MNMNRSNMLAMMNFFSFSPRPIRFHIALCTNTSVQMNVNGALAMIDIVSFFPIVLRDFFRIAVALHIQIRRQEFDISVKITILNGCAMASFSDKSKLKFQSEYTSTLFFVELKNGAYCLLCPSTQKLFQVYKKSNFERHLKNKHSDRIATLPSSESRSKLANELIEQLEKVIYEEVLAVIEARCKNQSVSRNIVVASYALAYEIAKNSKPFEEGNFIKKCINIVSSYICPEMKQNFEQIALSSRSVCRRIDLIHEYLNLQLKSMINDAVYYSVALDESTDIKDVAQLCIFIRGINKNFEIFEELLSLQPMVGQTTGAEFLKEFEKCQNKYDIEFKKMVSATTDGCPSMVGRIKGFVALLKQEFRKQNIPHELLSIHCLIHQEALCKKTLKLDNVTSVVVNFVNFVRGSSLRHRQFVNFMRERGSEYSDVFQYQHVRWLSLGKVLSRVSRMKEGIVAYLKKIENTAYPQFENAEWLNEFAFAVDILSLLNSLNLQLQGKNSFAYDMHKCIADFIVNLHLLHVDISFGKIDQEYFPTLYERKELIKEEQFPRFAETLTRLYNDLNSRFSDMKLIATQLKYTFDILDIELEVDDNIPETPEIAQIRAIQNSPELMQQYTDENRSILSFFNDLPDEHFKELKLLACRNFVLFGSTYNCESLFSIMNLNKSKQRSELKEGKLDAILKIATTRIVPDFEKIASGD